MSQISDKQALAQGSQVDLNYLSTNGYLNVMKKEDYDQAVSDVSNLGQMNVQMLNETSEARAAAATLAKDEGHTHSILFHLEGREKQEAELQRLEAERIATAKEQSDVAALDLRIKDLIQKKSITDRMVPYDGEYLSLTGLGVLTLNDLNVRNYRVSDMEFSSFVEERMETLGELHSIAQNGGLQETSLKTRLPQADYSQLWNVSIGLAKLQADQNQINQRFLLALGALQHFGSTLDNKMMAAEIMTSMSTRPSQSSIDNSDLQGMSNALQSLEHDVRHHAHVPKELSAGVAATMLFGRRYDGTYPLDKLIEYAKMTRSYESAAILSVMNDPSNLLPNKFQSFRMMFSYWGYQMSEDTELASAYLAISDLGGPNDVSTKLAIIVGALKTYLEYPLVAAAILASIPTFEANETLDLMEKAYSQLWRFAVGLERSELISLAVRIIHGIKNELVKQLDPTAKIANTPIQFTHPPSVIFFPFRGPLIIAHSSYYSTFSGIGGAHPAHVHGVGGFGG
ncbi:hypothetical protein J2P12_05360 [Candidatus Bathyarchaeota archaeon]|nr:hypothetical protein [Candidatus Bathyarchaeota archaeon]